MYLSSTLVITSLLASIVNSSPLFPLAREPNAQPKQTLTFTESENNGYCFAKLDNILGCSGETIYPIGEFVNDRCTKFTSALADNEPSAAIPVCDRKLTVTWTKDVWGNQQAAFKFPKADIGEERMEIVGVNFYTKGVANEVGVTENFLTW
ncbi:hypothetical protein N7510_004089 [Penicillium lagena]|uniref:uncharacterized protein n=1 Tax=Penicillium lagena TaxID=94218 RepID=UPI002541D649|nr:uncharacterized protein N7510_004089 [Penicillium lagena]KAJ5620105.1 hypothetical protein N7510_004089 [Penicillium lagena]